MKKIIGYKLKPKFLELKDTAAAIGHYNRDFDIQKFGLSDTMCIERLKKAEVLNFWFEPIYEENKPEFKVGDWIIGWSHNVVTKILIEDGAGFITSYKGQNNLAKNQYISLHSIKRYATAEEIKEHLVKEANQRGFVEGISWSNIESWSQNDVDIIRYSGYYIGKLLNNNWLYDIIKDKLTNRNAPIYQNGKWATIVEQPKIIKLYCDGGTFELEVSKRGIYFKPDNTWLNIEDLRQFLYNVNDVSMCIRRNTSGTYSFNVTRINMGCKKGVPVEDLRLVMNVYNDFQK